VTKKFKDGDLRVRYQDGDVKKQNMFSADWMWCIAVPEKEKEEGNSSPNMYQMHPAAPVQPTPSGGSWLPWTR
jgi:hypothetical protein